MSGTSLDGIDIALLNFTKDKDWSYNILKAETLTYPADWQIALSEAILLDDLLLDDLNQKYTRFLADEILNFVRRHEIDDLDAVCSHGHTIKHEPHKGFTLQIGNLPQLAEYLRFPVVCDFRVQDVALGGQGAPLVPVGDELLFNSYDYCLNLGGFGNISTSTNGSRIAYDICPVNTVLNDLSSRLNLSYDEGGAIAASGRLDEELLKKLNSLDFYYQKSPKSLGIEWVRHHVFPLFEEYSSVPNALHTFTVHVAMQIAKQLKGDQDRKVLITGGGAFNSFLIEELRKRTAVEIEIPSEDLINFKEALIFGFLGVLRLRSEKNILSSVTGASRDHSSGFIYRP